MPVRIFAIEITYLVLLIVVLVVYKTDHSFRQALPGFGSLPVSIAWFGATGGVVAGLGGVFFHNQDWNPAYDYWHYSRLLLGGVVGAVGALIYYALILLGTKNGVKPNVVVFDAVAFVFGFADEAFRELLTKFTKLVLGPGETKAGASGGGGHKTP
jgi:hypothetical protein